MRRRKRKKEWLPWYRARNYKGNLTEAEKRQLDAFRTQPTHPAARFDQLPEEVQSYIAGMEVELYDKKQGEAFGRAMFLSLVGAVLVALKYFGCITSPNWSYIGGAFLIVAPWFVYRHQWKKNAEEFLPSGDDAPRSATDEAFRYEWELNYIVAPKLRQRDGKERREPSFPDLSEEQKTHYAKTVQLVRFKCQYAEVFIEEKNKAKLEQFVETCLSDANALEDDFYRSGALLSIAELLAKAGEIDRAKDIAERIVIDFMRDQVMAEIRNAASRSTSDLSKEREA